MTETRYVVHNESELRAAVGSKRTIVVNGVIDLTRELEIGGKRRLRLVGPGSICRNRVLFDSCEDVCVESIRFRLGDEAGATDCVTVYQCERVWLSYCSFAWSVDEIVSISKSAYCKITNCLLAYPLCNSVHHKPKPHGLGPILDGEYLEFTDNFLAHIQYRPITSGSVIVANNTFYNYEKDRFPVTIASGRADVVGNVFAMGPDTTKNQRGIHKRSGATVYESGSTYCNRTVDNVSGGESVLAPQLGPRARFKERVELVGVFPRDGLDRLVERDWRYGQGKLIDEPNDLPGGWDLVKQFY